MPIVNQTRNFERVVKKLHPNQKRDLDAAVQAILKSPECGEQKKGDLRDIRVYKFRMNNQLTLLAYLFDAATQTVTALAVGTHENFYRALKG